MRTCGSLRFRRALATALSATLLIQPIVAQDKPTGAPLVLSTTETEQEVPLAILLPDGKTAKCVPIRVHWNSQPTVGPNDDATDFSIDLPADNPAAPIFSAQLWNASLASALAWQQPWEGARWKILQTPVSDGTGIDAALAVGMIATSARRPYPPKTVVIGSLNPDGSLGPVSHLLDRLNAAAEAGMTRVIIPSVQRFDTDASGQVVNIVKHAGELQLECIPVDDLVTATETTMNDPLPDTATLDSSIPKYSNDVATYIDDFAQREQRELQSGLKFAPKEADLATYPPRLASIWKSVYADLNGGQEAYRAGQVYTAYQLFCRANGRMNGANALAGKNRTNFDVKAALAESDDLHDHLQILMNPPSIDQGGLQSAVLVAQMGDWAFDVNAALEGSQLVTKQTFSQRSDATDAEKDRAREAILFANEQCKYLLTQADFYTGLLAHLAKNSVPVEENASHLLPQLIPAQLATARHFTEGIRASDLRDGLLFDPRLVAYVNVLRQVKSDWDSHQRRKEAQAQDAASAAPPVPTTNAPPANGSAPVKLNANANTSAVGFDPGDTFRPPHGVVLSTSSKKLSDVALCLIWVNHDCEIATLDEKYLRLNGTMDPKTHDWTLKDRPKLDALLQMAEIGARHGIAFAEKAEVDPSVLAMIYEMAAHQRTQGDDASALDALRNFWRCALLGNVCWQLAHTPKAQPVDLSALSSKDQEKLKKDQKKVETTKTDDSDNTPPEKTDAQAKKDESPAPSASTNTVVVVPANAQASTNEIVTPIAPTTNAAPVNTPPAPPAEPTVANTPPAAPAAVTPAADTNDYSNIPVAPIATNMTEEPAPPPAPVTNSTPAPAPPTPPAPPAAPVAVATPDTNEMNIPVAPIAKVEDYSGGAATPPTNTPPVNAPIPPSKSDNADGHSVP